MQDAELSSTYIGINLRTFRTMVNIAIRKGFVKGNTEKCSKTLAITRWKVERIYL